MKGEEDKPDEAKESEKESESEEVEADPYEPVQQMTFMQRKL